MSENSMLVVVEAYTRDVGHGIARIERQAMEDLGLSDGDIIEIKGRRATAARCVPDLTPEDLEAEPVQPSFGVQGHHRTGITEKEIHNTAFRYEGRGIPVHEMKSIPSGRTIRIDGLIRNNAGIAIGDAVSVRRIVAPQAEKVTVVPLENIPPIDERYLSDALENIPVTKGDNIMVPYFGGRLTFNVTEISPGTVSVVTQNTVFSITTQDTTLRAVGDFKYYSNGKEISFVLEHAVRKEDREDTYLMLKIHLHHGGFLRVGQFQARLGRDSSIQDLVSRYKKGAEETIVTPVPYTVPHGNSTVVYTINSGPKAGFYRMLISGPGMQLAIGYDNGSNFVREDFPWLDQGFFCGIGHNFQITGTSGIGVKFIPFK